MALDGTYSGLLASVADFLNRDDMTAVVPDFVTMATAQITRRLMKDGPVRQMMSAPTSLVVAAELVNVPADFMGARALYLAPNYKPLTFVDPEEIAYRKTLYPSQTGDPQVFSVVGGQFQFWPWSGSSFSGTLVYWQSIPALSVSAQTNWLLTAHPDIYLYTALIQSAPYLKADERLSVWGTLAQTGLDDLIQADKIARTAPHLGVGIVPGGTP